MLRAEPWEQPAALNEIQQQLLTLNLENKRQWYGRTPEPPHQPPDWLGFSKVIEDEPTCTDCAATQCVAFFLDAIPMENPACDLEEWPAVTRGPFAFYVPADFLPSLCLDVGGAGSPGSLEFPPYMSVVWSHPVVDDWRITVSIAKPPLGTCASSATYTADNCLGPYTLDPESVGGIGVLPEDWPTEITTTEYDCGDPPPTPTPTSSGSGSGGGSPDQGTADWIWMFGAWQLHAFSCASGFQAIEPDRPGAFDGEIVTTTCEF